MTTPWLFLIIAVPLTGCKKNNEAASEQNNEEQIYFYSFESPADTSGWQGDMEFRDDVPPSGGNRSVFISGGCIVPHAYVTLISPASESYLSMRC